MSETIQIEKRGGGQAKAALVLPQNPHRAPGIIIVHEWWGLNADIVGLAERFAAEGFIAIAPDLYGGQVTDRPERAMELSGAMQTPDAMAVIAGAVAYLQASPRCSGRIGVTGFCLGGAMALAAACNVEGIGASVPFYGLPMAKFADWSRVTAPIQGHFAEKDHFVPAAKVRATAEAIEAAGKSLELYFYDADHAFMRAGDPQAYHAPSAELAWQRAIGFLHRHLG